MARRSRGTRERSNLPSASGPRGELPYNPGSPGSPVITVSTFESEPEAPWLSVTVTRIVKLPSRYECDALIVPWLDVLPLADEPSPQLMVYDHGPSLFGSLNDAVSV